MDWVSPHCQGLGRDGSVKGYGRTTRRMFRPLLAKHLQHTMERKRLTVPLGRLCPFTPRLCWWDSQGGS